MRTRLLGFISALVLAALGAAVPVAQAAAPAVTGPACVAAHGKVVYDSGTGLWTCIGGRYDDEPITT
ncbi:MULTISPECIES: hypothetical protein [unclassified Streptomyces]|uniref:hypothetical protein n=1 Tax=unclassified Streptomyces TaxID=2593676 RepID=UPI002E2F6F0D|nr:MULTISPECIES: hypothetical protein [unclassified Streptomyces]WUC68184.1 hypothetical protein OG861_30260 [Streptomyces sp. NBC_00539]